MQTVNPNFKTCVRVRPCETNTKMVECTTDTITIRDVTGKTSNDKHTFQFNTVWDTNISQDTIFKYVCDHTISKLLDGTNSTVISYGQSGSGKTYTIFGEDENYSTLPIGALGEKRDRKGLIPKTIEYLLEVTEQLKDTKNIIITCNFLEVYLDQIRDLGKVYHEMKQMHVNPSKKALAANIANIELENLDIYEHSNGQMLVKNITTHHITSLNDLYDLLTTGFKMRDKMDAKTGSQLWNRAHTVVILHVVQRDLKNDNLPISNATLQFVDLSGSERIAKSITEGQQKVQETLQISGSLTSLGRVLLSIACSNKSVPFKECRLTKILYSGLNHTSNVVLIANVNPNEQCFEETFMTLQYTDRCQTIDPNKEKGNRIVPINSNNMGLIQGVDENIVAYYATTANNDKMLRKMADELTEVRTKFDQQNKDLRNKLDRLRITLGLDIDFEKLINNPNGKEGQVILNLKQAVQENENLRKIIKDHEHQIDVLENERKNDLREHQKEQNKLITEIIRGKELMKKELDLAKAGFNKIEENLKKQIAELKSEIFRLQSNNSSILEEKTNVIFQFNQNLNLKSQELFTRDEKKNYSRKEAEVEFKEELERMKKEQEMLVKTTKLQCDQFMKEKQNELEQIIIQFKQYRKDKKEQIQSMKNELIELYDIIQRQNRIIEKVDLGMYSGGLRSFNIPQKDKPLLPSRMKFKYLFKYLDQTKVETASARTLLEKSKEEKGDVLRNTWMEFRKYPLMNGTLSLTKSNNSFPTKLNDSTLKSSLESSIRKDNPNTNTNTNNNNTQNEGNPREEKLSTINELDDFEVDLNANVKKLLEPDVRVYCEKLKLACKKYKQLAKENWDIVEKYNRLNVYGDINTILAEKDKYEQLYKEELKKNHDQKIAFETQKRALSIHTKISATNSINAFPKLTPTTFATAISPKSLKITPFSKQRPATSASSTGLC